MKTGRQDYDAEHIAESIPGDEPVFVLRAQDITAAATVEYWAEQNELLGGDPVAIAEVREHARRMRAWPIRKLADAPRPDR